MKDYEILNKMLNELEILENKMSENARIIQQKLNELNKIRDIVREDDICLNTFNEIKKTINVILNFTEDEQLKQFRLYDDYQSRRIRIEPIFEDGSVKERGYDYYVDTKQREKMINYLLKLKLENDLLLKEEVKKHKI